MADETTKSPKAPDTLLAPAPIVDRWPIVIGQNLTGAYVTNAFRLCTLGWRYHFVDVLNELLEHDPHARGVVRQRIVTVAAARLQVQACELPTNHPDEARAAEICAEVTRQINAIPMRTQAFARLCWGIIYGVACEEITWRRSDRVGVRWEIAGLQLVHSRRLNYTSPSTWDLYVWDQGTVGGPAGFGLWATNGYLGLRVDDYAHKFIVHTPQLSGDYPTRDGEGRYIGFYLLLKRGIIRATAQDFERTIRPWVVGYFGREGDKTKNPVAVDADIDRLNEAVKALGLGSLNGVVLPDSVRLEILKAASTANAQEFVDFLDRQVSKGLLGQTFTTDTGKFGNRSTANVGRQGSLDIARYDAQCLADTLEKHVLGSIIALNFPGEEHLCPSITLLVDERPDPRVMMDLASKGTAIDMPVDIDKLGELTGLPLLAADDETGRRTRAVSAGRAIEPGSDDPNEHVEPEGEELEEIDEDETEEPGPDVTEPEDTEAVEQAAE